jgi:hypothetical protein
MIQRIQTIWLLIIVVLAIIGTVFPLTGFAVGVKGDIHNPYALPLKVAISCIAVIAMIAVFLYKNRKLQIVWCYVGSVISILVTSFVLFVSYFSPDFRPTFCAMLIIPCFALFFSAIHHIKKDEKLVRSADRLR